MIEQKVHEVCVFRNIPVLSPFLSVWWEDTKHKSCLIFIGDLLTIKVLLAWQRFLETSVIWQVIRQGCLGHWLGMFVLGAWAEPSAHCFLGHPRAQGTSGADAAWASVASAGLEAKICGKNLTDKIGWTAGWRVLVGAKKPSKDGCAISVRDWDGMGINISGWGEV